MSFKNVVLRYSVVVLVLCYVTNVLSKASTDTKTVYVNTNETEVELECHTSAKVAWLRGKDVLVLGSEPNTSDWRIDVSNSFRVKKLHIRDIMSNYSGVYRCVEYNGKEVTNKTIATYNVIVVVALNAGEKQNNLTIREGEHARLACQVHGRPEPRIKWFMVNRDDNILDIGINGRMLIIQNFTRECAVTYMCIAENDHSDSVNQTMTPIPLFSPEIKSSASNANATEISNVLYIPCKLYYKVKLVCHVEASPFTHLTWYRGDIFLAHVSFSEDYKENITLSSDYILGLSSSVFKLEKDSKTSYTYEASIQMRMEPGMFGEHQCTTSNMYGTSKKVFNITKA